MAAALTPAQKAIFDSGSATVVFEDHGQDFLRFHIQDRRVVACEPFQADIWCGIEVTGFPVVGELLEFRRDDGKLTCIKYPIARVEPLWDRTNPFKSIVVNGKQLYTVTADDRVRMVAKFTEAQCHAALQVDGLQKTVTTAVARRLRQLSKQRGGSA